MKKRRVYIMAKAKKKKVSAKKPAARKISAKRSPTKRSPKISKARAAVSRSPLEAIPFARFTVECQSQLEKQSKASRVRQSVTSLFGLTEDEGGEGEEGEEAAAPAEAKE